MTNDRLAQVEAELRRVADELRALDQRLAALERASAAAPAPPVEAEREARPSGTGALAPPLDLTTPLSLAGRTLVVLAGAFLLRALTDAGVLAPAAGVLTGMGYACAWLVMADRAGAQGRWTSASVHGLAFALIALPLLFEATVKYRLWPASAAAGVLAGIVTIALAGAWRRRLRGLAWIATLGSLALAPALMAATGRLAPFAAVLVLIGVATLWAGYVLDWVGLRWPAALVTDLTVLLLSARSVTPRSLDTPAEALVAQVGLLALYLGSFAVRTLLLNRDVIPFEVTQSAAVLAVGLGGAAYVTRMTGVGAVPLGLVSLALGAGCYLVAIAFVERRQRRRKNFHFYTAAAFVFTVTGTALLFAPAPRGLVWSALALVAAAGGRGLASLTLKAHAAAYTIAAAGAGGWLAHVAHGLGAPFAPPWPSVSTYDLVGLAAAVATTGIVVQAGPGPYPTRLSRIPGVVLLAASTGGVLGTVVAWAAGAIAGDGPPSLGVVATLRTATLVGASLGLALAGRSPRVPEAGWLVAPLLVVAGVKLVLEDLRASRPATLFAAFALYGAALILAPRLRRRT